MIQRVKLIEESLIDELNRAWEPLRNQEGLRFKEKLSSHLENVFYESYEQLRELRVKFHLSSRGVWVLDGDLKGVGYPSILGLGFSVVKR